MKNTLRILPFLTFFLVACSSFAQDLANKPKTLVIQANDVLLRESPATGKMILTMKEGSVCRYFSRKDFEIINGTPDYWYEAEYNGKRGWVFGGLTSARQHSKQFVVATAQQLWEIFKQHCEDDCRAAKDCKGSYEQESETSIHCYCKLPSGSDRWQDNPFFFARLGAKKEGEFAAISINDHKIDKDGTIHHVNKVVLALYKNNSWQMRMADELTAGFRQLIPWQKQQKLIVTADRQTGVFDTCTVFLLNPAQGNSITKVGSQRLEHYSTLIDSLTITPVSTAGSRALKFTEYVTGGNPHETFLPWDEVQNKFVSPLADDTSSVKKYFQEAFLVKPEIDVFMDCAPTLGECKKLFTAANGETYFNYQQTFMASGAKEIEQERKRGIKKNYGVKARSYSIEDFKKSEGGDRKQMAGIADKLNPGITFYEVEIQRGDNINSFGTSTVKFIAKVGNRYVILNKAWMAFEKSH